MKEHFKEIEKAIDDYKIAEELYYNALVNADGTPASEAELADLKQKKEIASQKAHNLIVGK